MKPEIQAIRESYGRPFNITDYILSEKLDLTIPYDGFEYLSVALSHTQEILEELYKFERNRNEREEIERILLRETIRYAKERIPSYAKKYEGINAKDIESPEDICHLPFLTDEEIKRHPEAWTVPEKIHGDNFCIFSTKASGSSVKHAFYSARDEIVGYMVSALGLRKIGLRKGEKYLICANYPDMAEDQQWAARLLKAWVWRHFVDNTGDALETIKYLNPEFLFVAPIGNTHVTMEDLLRYDVKTGFLHRLEGKTIIFGGSPAPVGLIENIYEIINPELISVGYGSVLTSGYFSCPESLITQKKLRERYGYVSESHIPPGEWAIYNFKDESQPLPEITITTLGREIMPLINYRINDFAKIERCDCGLDLISDICRKEWVKMEPDGGIIVDIPYSYPLLCE